MELLGSYLKSKCEIKNRNYMNLCISYDEVIHRIATIKMIDNQELNMNMLICK